MVDGAICGALPSTLYSKHDCKRYNFADVQHIQSQHKDSSLLLSSDPKIIQFYFDCFTNFKVNQQDVRFVFNRGLQEIKTPRDDSVLLKMDEEDSRRIVKELAAAIKTKEPTFYLDHDAQSK